MSKLQEEILKIYPAATFEEGECPLVNVAEADWHDFARKLKETPSLGFDVLTAVVGMDWKEKLGVVYYLTSTSHNWDMLAVKVEASGDRDNAYIHTVSELWKLANFQ